MKMMKSILIVMVTVALLLMVGCTRQGSVASTGEYQKVTAQEAKDRIDAGSYDVILDVRTLEEYSEGHIKDAVLLPSDEIMEKAEVTLADKDAVILVYCRSGRRSEAAAKQLIDMGYTQVYDFGGIIDWPYDVVK